jgi:UDP-2-acetamido-3-amino-2,3-dideoxy-glucuronate N-acetyltransferase
MSLKKVGNHSVHSLADVQSEQVGEGTVIWQFCVVLSNAQIGKFCNVNASVFIENDVVIGDNVTIKCGVQLWDGIRIQDFVQVGPNVTFSNDRFPKAKRKFKIEITFVEKGASIGANATICPGLTIGRHSIVGAGAVVTKDVQPYSVVVGNPAVRKGYITLDGIRLDEQMRDEYDSLYEWGESGELIKVNDQIS